jgi:hypothetical protein
MRTVSGISEALCIDLQVCRAENRIKRTDIGGSKQVPQELDLRMRN